MKLTEGARIIGQVLLNDKPLQGVTVTAYAELVTGKQLLTSSETDEAGEYIIYAPTAKVLKLVNLQDFPVRNGVVSVSKFEVIPTDDPLLFTVAPLKVVAGSGEVRGTVVDEIGNAVPHAIVGFDIPRDQVWIQNQMLSKLKPSSVPWFTTKADAAGNFVLYDLPAGDLPLIATDATNDTWINKTRITKPVQVAVGSQEIKIVLPQR